MRRLLALAAVVVLGVTVAVARGSDGGSGGQYRVDAIFDSASQVLAGQDVRIAGARVGTVVDVSLTPERRARIALEVDPRFAPFRADADCTIQPQSLIGEKFVQCVPGTPKAKALAARGDAPPTLPVERTHAPVDLDLVLSALRLPYRQRLSVITNELGAGVAGQGTDLNATLRRAVPTLDATRRMLGALDAERRRLGPLVDESQRIASVLAGRSRDVEAFLDRAAELAARSGAHSDDLGAAVAELDPALARAEPALEQVTRFAAAGTPLARDLRRAAPALTRLIGTVSPFAKAARPAVSAVAGAARPGLRAMQAGDTVVADLRRFAGEVGPIGAQLAALSGSLRDRGVVEGLLTFVHLAAGASVRFDSTSHITPAHLVFGPCGPYATSPVPGCDAHFAGAAPATARARKRRSTPAKPKRSAPAEPATPAAPQPALPAAPTPPAPAPDPRGPVEALLDFLLGGDPPPLLKGLRP